MDAIAELEERLARYPPERYPVQHGVTQFHLGLALTNAHRAAEGGQSLERAVELFAAAGMQVERAKALNALGAALRDVGDDERAADAFAEAAGVFGREGLQPEEAAALFNLGLIRRDPGPLRRARELFAEAMHHAQNAAAERELGTLLLERGETGPAISTLTSAAALAESAGDESGRGAALNALGIALLAAGRAREAVEAFRAAAATHPRGIRPAEFAMAKANLALAYERMNDSVRARLAARQALGVRADPAVSAQAEAVLARLGKIEDDLARVLAPEDSDRRVAIVREEVTRWADAAPSQRSRDAELWIATQLDDGELALPWLAALLELAPDALDVVVRSTLQALAARGEQDQERFRRDVVAASARFHAPQLERLRENFERLGAELGYERRWS